MKRICALLLCSVLLIQTAFAADSVKKMPAVNLGDAYNFAVLAAKGLDNYGENTIVGDVGDNGSEFKPVIFGKITGDTYPRGAGTQKAMSDARTAFDRVLGLEATQTISVSVGEQTFFSGLYRAEGSVQLGGKLTLNANGNSQSVFIFEVSSLDVAKIAQVSLINGALAENVYWFVKGDAKFGQNVNFAGSVVSNGAISVEAESKIKGRLISLNDKVSISNVGITKSENAYTGFSNSKVEIVMKIGSKDMVVNEKPQVSDVAPMIKDGRTYVPVSFITQQLGGRAEYTTGTKGRVNNVTLIFPDVAVYFEIGSNVIGIEKNFLKETSLIDAKPIIVEGRTMIPFKILADALGAKASFGMKADNSGVEWVKFEK